MYTLYTVSKYLRQFVVGVGKVGAWLSLLLMLVIMYDVVTRNGISYLQHSGIISAETAKSLSIISSTKLQEMEWHLHAVLFLVCFGFAYMRDAHVRIELVRDRLKPRTKLWIELFGIVFFMAPYVVLMVYFGYDFAHRSYETGEVSAALTGLPHRWIIKAFLPIGFLLIGLAGLSQFLRTIVALFGPAELREEAAAYVQVEEIEIPEEANQPDTTQQAETK
jgi:TRAP-type mannitol/chloroaromatic compound transport system permease small subunit